MAAGQNLLLPLVLTLVLTLGFVPTLGACRPVGLTVPQPVHATIGNL